MKINKCGHKMIFFKPPFRPILWDFQERSSSLTHFVCVCNLYNDSFSYASMDDHRPCFLYFLLSQTKQALGEFPRLAHNDDLKIDWDENVRKGVNYKLQPVLWIRIILIRIRIRGSGSGKSGSGSDQKSKKITTFFFDKKYDTQSYDFYCYLLAYYSYSYINQKSDLFFKII